MEIFLLNFSLPLTMKKAQILLFSLLTLSGCGLLITQKILLGVSKPKVQSVEKIQKFLTKNTEFDSTYTLNKESFISKIKSSSNYFATWELYDDYGNQLIPQDSNVHNCNGYTQSFFKNLQNKNYDTDLKKNIFNDTLFCSGFTLLNGNYYDFLKIKRSDYLLVIYWSTFMGKYSTDLFNLEKLAKNNNNIQISTVKINMDFKTYYGFTNKDLKVEMNVKKE